MRRDDFRRVVGFRARLDFRLGFALERLVGFRFRDLAAPRAGFLLAVNLRVVFLARLGAGLSTFRAAFLTAGFNRP